MSNETFLISLKQNNDLTDNSIANLRLFLSQFPLQQRKYVQFAKLIGNSRKYGIRTLPKQQNKLSTKRVIFLGSTASSSYGSLGEDLTEYLYEKDFLFSTLDFEFGHGLSDIGSVSMVSRWKQLLKETMPDLLAIELPVSDSNNLQTAIDNLEIMIKYTQSTWTCPIIIYTANYFEDKKYEQLIAQAKDISNRYSIDLIDFYHDQDIKVKSKLYTVEQGYPTRAGLKDVWLPKFERQIFNSLYKKS